MTSKYAPFIDTTLGLVTDQVLSVFIPTMLEIVKATASKTVTPSISERCFLEYEVRIRIGDGLCRRCRNDQRLLIWNEAGELGKIVFPNSVLFGFHQDFLKPLKNLKLDRQNSL